MNRKINLRQVFVFSGLLWLAGCVKTAGGPFGSAALNVVNAVNNSNPLVTNFTPFNGKGVASSALQYYANASTIGYASAWETGAYAGSVYLSLSQTSDTMTSIWSGALSLAAGSVHTLFLSGDTTAVDTLFSTDILPAYTGTDSSSGLRFVNLATGSGPMTVNLQRNPGTQTEFAGLGYRQLSGFKTYSAAKSAGGSYTFEIRDQASDSVLTTYRWSYKLQRSHTVVISGTEAGGLVVFQVNDF